METLFKGKKIQKRKFLLFVRGKVEREKKYSKTIIVIPLYRNKN